jgi:hypothetical protein
MYHEFLTFSLFLTNVCRYTTEHYFCRVKSLLKTTHSRTGRQNLTTRYFYWLTVLFSSSDNPDGTWCSGHWKITGKPTSYMYYSCLLKRVVKHDQFVHVMKVLHFKNIQTPPDRMSCNNDTWQIRWIFDCWNNIYFTVYHPTENLALDEV